MKVHSAWSESTRVTPWPPVRGPQLPTAYCTFCTWAMERYRLWVTISSQKTVNLWTRNLNFWHLGARAQKLGAYGPPKLYAVNFSRGLVLYTSLWDICRTQNEPPGRRAFKNRPSPKVFLQSLAFHRKCYDGLRQPLLTVFMRLTYTRQ